MHWTRKNKDDKKSHHRAPVSVSVPRDVRDSMDRLKGGYNVNWSAVAAEAFLKVIQEIDSQENET